MRFKIGTAFFHTEILHTLHTSQRTQIHRIRIKLTIIRENYGSFAEEEGASTEALAISEGASGCVAAPGSEEAPVAVELGLGAGSDLSAGALLDACS
mmetsp:Transcript_1653/g.2945  ORF Transcript_1653/g.2945 Transcript_1653/m.2945 type:complete len:97 (+) Transcript_1653:1241-1531(+)